MLVCALSRIRVNTLSELWNRNTLIGSSPSQSLAVNSMQAELSTFSEGDFRSVFIIDPHLRVTMEYTVLLNLTFPHFLRLASVRSA